MGSHKEGGHVEMVNGSTEQPINILIVEDNGNESDRFKLLLELMGFTTYDTSSHVEAHELFSQRDYNLVIIHLEKAPLESLDFCRWVRAKSMVPILMLTIRSEIVDEEMVMNAGASDYVTKPINENIFISRVLDQLKREQIQRTSRENIVAWQNLELDLNEHSFKVGGKHVELTNTEYQFLKLLMQNPKQAFRRHQILEAVDTLKGHASEAVIDSHVSRLRKKIKENGGPAAIAVVRSVGFRLEDVRKTEN
jgi:DNA-binding response OmpR family regulator